MEKSWYETKSTEGLPQLKNDDDDGTMMLVADYDFWKREETRKFVANYARDQNLFFKDFVKAWQKLVELGDFYFIIMWHFIFIFIFVCVSCLPKL